MKKRLRDFLKFILKCSDYEADFLLYILNYICISFLILFFGFILIGITLLLSFDWFVYGQPDVFFDVFPYPIFDDSILKWFCIMFCYFFIVGAISFYLNIELKVTWYKYEYCLTFKIIFQYIIPWIYLLYVYYNGLIILQECRFYEYVDIVYNKWPGKIIRIWDYESLRDALFEIIKQNVPETVSVLVINHIAKYYLINGDYKAFFKKRNITNIKEVFEFVDHCFYKFTLDKTFIKPEPGTKFYYWKLRKIPNKWGIFTSWGINYRTYQNTRLTYKYYIKYKNSGGYGVDTWYSKLILSIINKIWYGDWIRKTIGIWMMHNPIVITILVCIFWLVVILFICLIIRVIRDVWDI